MYKFTILVLVFLISLSFPVRAIDDNVEYFNSDSWNEIFAAEDTVDYPVVFIHGLARGADVWEESVKIISDDDFFEMKYKKNNELFYNYHGYKQDNTIWTISYYTENPFEEALSGNLNLYALRLEIMIDIIKNLTGHEKVVLISHSMGGLIARKYMVTKEENWNSVHKILTVGTPHQGVESSLGIIGQLEDLQKESDFLIELDNSWNKKSDSKDKKWGVVGGIDTQMFFNEINNKDATDSGGPGFVKISSAIPYEWAEAIGENFAKASYDSDKFGFRMAVDSTHIGLLENRGTFMGVHWAIIK